MKIVDFITNITGLWIISVFFFIVTVVDLIRKQFVLCLELSDFFKSSSGKPTVLYVWQGVTCRCS